MIHKSIISVASHFRFMFSEVKANPPTISFRLETNAE
jgi:hypothetical protein